MTNLIIQVDKKWYKIQTLQKENKNSLYIKVSLLQKKDKYYGTQKYLKNKEYE